MSSNTSYRIDSNEPDEGLDFEAQVGELTRWVSFTVADEVYAVNVLDVQEVLRDAEITPIPGATDAIIGIINLRGNVVTVVDSRVYFGLEEKPRDEHSRIMVIELFNNEVVGLIVDSVAEVIILDEETVKAASRVGNEEGSRHILGVVPQDDRLVILVEMKGLAELADG